MSNAGRKLAVFVLSFVIVMTTLHVFTFPASAMTRAMGEADPGIVLGTETDETEETANPSEPAPAEVSDSEELSLTDGQTDETDSELAETAAEPEEAEEPAAPATETAPEPAEPAVSVLPDEAEDRNETDDAETVLTLTGSANRLDVTVEYEAGTFPEGTTMEVITVGSPSVINAINEAVAENNKEAVRIQAVDIIFRSSDGEKIEPSRPVRVTMKSKSIPANASDSPVVVHVDDALDTSVMNAELTENETSQKTVAFEADSFSVYAVVYTVDFEYEVDGNTYQYSIAGGESITLSRLAEVLGMIDGVNFADTADFLAKVETVEFTDPQLIQITRAETDWLLESLNPFSSEECLTITMKNGNVITVKVTDAQRVTVTGTLQGTTMKGLGDYNVYGYLLAQNGSGEAYGVKINFADGNFEGTIPADVPEGKYRFVLAYRENNQALQEGKWNRNNVEECINVPRDGTYIFGYTANLPEGNVTISAENHEVHFALEVSDIQTNIDVKTLMDRAINYGIVGENVSLPNNCYTNFAAKSLNIANQNTQTHYYERSEGIDVVPNIAAAVVNNGQPLTTEMAQPASYYVTDADSGKVNSTNQEETIVRNVHELEDRVEIMLSNTLKQAEQLAHQSSVTLPGKLISVDVSPYGESSTIILDATKISGELNGFTIVKRPGQTVVFNIGGQNAAPPQNIKIKLVDNNGNQIDKDGNPSRKLYVAGDEMKHASASEGNVWNKIIWNFPDAQTVTATNQIGGIFLVPKGSFNAANKGGGWIVARNNVSVTNEWYAFPGEDEPFKQKIVRKTFVGIEDGHIDPKYALKLWTHTNESTSGTTMDQLITTLVLKPDTDPDLVRDPTGIHDQTGYQNTGKDEDGNTYYEWKTPNISVGNEHKLTETNTAGTGEEHLDEIDFVGPYSEWSEEAHDYIWRAREATFTSEAAFEGIFNVSSHNEDYRLYVYVTNRYDVERLPHSLTLTKRVTDHEEIEPEGQEYTFEITLKDEAGTLIEDQQIQYSLNSGEPQTIKSTDGVVTISLKKDETVRLIDLPYGTQYSIVETSVPAKCEVAFSGDTSETAKGVGRLIKDRSVTATNTYSDDPGVPVVAHKDLKDGQLTAGQFTFRLVNSAGITVKTATNDANGHIAFDTLTFTQDGEYDYRMYEVVDLGMKDIIFDTSVKNVHIAVRGGRAREITYDGTSVIPLFINRKINPDSDTLTARKIFIDAEDKAVDLEGGEFTFTVTGSDGSRYTGVNAADGMVEFRDAEGNPVDLDTLTETTTFVISENPDSYTGTVPVGQKLTYDTNSHNAKATVETKTVTVTPWTQRVIDENSTELTMSLAPSDQSGDTYYCFTFNNIVNYARIKSDGTVTFSFTIPAQVVGANNTRTFTFDYGKGSDAYNGNTPLGQVSITASAGSDPWNNPKNVTVSSVKVDGEELVETTHIEKTVTLDYEAGAYPVFINRLSKTDVETTDFTFHKVWRDAMGERAVSWPEDKTITVRILQAVSETDPDPAVYANYTISATDVSAVGTEITADEGETLPKLNVIGIAENDYSFRLEGIPAKSEDDETFIYSVSEPEGVEGYQQPKYYQGSERKMGASSIGDSGTIANDIMGYELPKTGGIGTGLFRTLGGILILGAGLYLAGRKHTR